MECLQVKEYHNTIAKEKQNKALEHWRNKNNGYSYPVKTMFVFMLGDNERQKGYIAFDNTRACFGMNRDKAIAKFNKTLI